MQDIRIANYEGKSLNISNSILNCMKKYAQRKILFRDTKWLLSNMSYRGREDQAVWACAVGCTTWPLHCQFAPWKRNEALFVFCGQRVWNLLKSFHPSIHPPLVQTTVSILNIHSSVYFRRFHTLWPQKTNNASLLFHGTSWQWSGYVVRPTAQAQTAWSSRPVYDILPRSHFVSRNKILRLHTFSFILKQHSCYLMTFPHIYNF